MVCVIFRLRSVGYDLLKQRGKWQATGMNPVDLGLEFASIFTHDVEDLSEALINDTDMPGSQVRKFLCNTFQVP